MISKAKLWVSDHLLGRGFAEALVKHGADDIATKSAMGTSTYTTSDISMRARVVLSNNPVDLMGYANLGWVSACLGKRQTYASSVPVHLYAEVPADATPMIAHKTLDRKLVKRVIKAAGRNAVGKTVVEIMDHPLIDLMRLPDPDMSYQGWMAVLIGYLDLIGNAYFEVVRKGSKIVGLKPLLSEFMFLQLSPDGRVIKYCYMPAAQHTVTKEYDPKDILHIRNSKAGSLSYGRGTVEGCLLECAILRDMSQSIISISQNSGVPSAHIQVSGKVGSQKEADEAAERFRAKYSGMNRGRPMVTFADEKTGNKVDITTLQFKPSDMLYPEQMLEARKVVAASFEVPMDLLSSENSNRASAVTALDHFKEYTVLPLLTLVFSELSKLCEEYDDRLFFGYDASEVVQGDVTKQSQMLDLYVKDSIMTIAEARSAIGLDAKVDEVDEEDADVVEPAKPEKPDVQTDKENA